MPILSLYNYPFKEPGFPTALAFPEQVTIKKGRKLWKIKNEEERKKEVAFLNPIVGSLRK